MTAFVEEVSRGDVLVAIQGDLKLKVVALADFNGGPGYPASISVIVKDTLAGSLPSHVEELVLNANGWDLYSEGDSRASASPKSSTKKTPLIQTVDPETRWEDGVDHDSRTEELWRWLQEYDRKFCGYEYSDLLSSGGDGDPGEGIMYLIDEYFAAKDTEGTHST